MKNMTAMSAKRKQAGFTIIELVVVILLLGILTATALPRFMDVTDEAHEAVVDAVTGGLQTGTALFRAQWIAEGQPLTAVVSEFNLYASPGGYPLGNTIDSTEIGAATGTDLCASAYENILQSGRPPIYHLISTGVVAGIDGTSTDTAATREAAVETAAANALYAGDIIPVFVETPTGSESQTCAYYYVAQYSSGNATTSRDIPTITYNFVTGNITRSDTTFQTTE